MEAGPHRRDIRDILIVIEIVVERREFILRTLSCVGIIVHLRKENCFRSLQPGKSVVRASRQNATPSRVGSSTVYESDRTRSITPMLCGPQEAAVTFCPRASSIGY